MCRSMVDIQSVVAEIRRGKKQEDRKKLQGKNIMAPLLHRAAINSTKICPHLLRRAAIIIAVSGKKKTINLT